MASKTLVPPCWEYYTVYYLRPGMLIEDGILNDHLRSKRFYM
jgi:hypothetical protein